MNTVQLHLPGSKSVTALLFNYFDTALKWMEEQKEWSPAQFLAVKCLKTWSRADRIIVKTKDSVRFFQIKLTVIHFRIIKIRDTIKIIDFVVIY
jgi:hypothetical protein